MPGHMSVLEAQGMDMSVMKPPVGAVPVAAMAAKRQTIESTVSYTGSAVSFVDQDVYPRVTGWITWMPFYPGERVRRGQLLARLDATELGSKVNEQVAARSMAEHAHMIARMQYQQALGARAQAQAQVQEARNEQVNAAIRGARSRIKKAEATAGAARDKVAGMAAKVQSSQAKIEQAQANARALTAAADAAQHEIAHTQAGIQQAQAQVSTAE